MIGYYAHHVGSGHLRHATSIAAALDGEATGLSSAPRPADWVGAWVDLARDDTGPPLNPTAHGALHWAPVHDAGLAARMGRIAAWIAETRPSVLVVDVSVEVAVFARLMGVPVVVMALPGDRSDSAHRLGYSVADAILAPWPAGLDELDREFASWADRVHHVGGISRFAGRPAVPAPSSPRRRVLVLQGTGGTSLRTEDVAAAGAVTPEWDWHRVGPGAWSEDPWPELCAADVVVTHAGLGALADVAAAGRPAIVLPEDRPHDEQRATARALGAAGLALTVERWPAAHEWPQLLARAHAGGSIWHRWGTDGAAARAARVIEATADAALDQRVPSCA